MWSPWSEPDFVGGQHVERRAGLDASDLIAESLAVCLGNRQRRSADAGVGDDDAAQKIDGIPDRKSRDSPVERRRVIERQQTIAIREGNRLSRRNRAAELECGTITYRERPAAGDTAEDDGSAIRLNTHRAGIVECERASGRGREDACAGYIDRS